MTTRGTGHYKLQRGCYGMLSNYRTNRVKRLCFTVGESENDVSELLIDQNTISCMAIQIFNFTNEFTSIFFTQLLVQLFAKKLRGKSVRTLTGIDDFLSL